MSHIAPVIEKFETPSPREEQIIDEILARIEAQLGKDFRKDKKADAKALMHRDQHSKQHGCVEASFEVREDLPARYAQGVFQPGARYRAWVRFSNGNPLAQHDRKGDGRGMAVKLVGVPGKKLLEGIFEDSAFAHTEKETQDFVMINHPVFFIDNLETYRVFTRLTQSRNLLKVAAFFLAWPRLARVVWGIVKQKVFNPLHVTYHSMTPYLLGPDLAVKFSATPVSGEDGLALADEPGPRESFNYLRDAMEKTLEPGSGHAACFDFFAHVRRDERLPIEDPSRLWPESGAPKMRLARLTIPTQVFKTEARMEFGRNLSFSPWHCVPEHQPLGGINRARLAIYRAISELRHASNEAPAIEPLSEEERERPELLPEAHEPAAADGHEPAAADGRR